MQARQMGCADAAKYPIMRDETKATTALQRLVHSDAFNYSILAVIVFNSILIGVETYHEGSFSHDIQLFILFVFVIEIILRWFGRLSLRSYLSDGWNYFDIIIVLVSLVPEMWQDENDSSIFAALRILRVLKIFRSIRAVGELRVITGVLLRSLRSLSYTGLLFFIFMYVYAVVGVSLFKNIDYVNSLNYQLNPTQPDPYGDIGEAFFSLFRILTGEDWTDLRYNLMNGQTKASNIVVTGYHVSWMIISAILFLNLVVGAVVNNFHEVLEQKKIEEEQQARKYLKEKVGNKELPEG